MAPIYLIAGAPASGKSSAASALAAGFARGLHINVDHLRNMVVGGVEHPGGAWSDALMTQLRLARTTAVEMALRYHAAGFGVAIDDFWDPVSALAEYAPLDAHPNVMRVLLLPDESQVRAQALRRAGSAEAAAYFEPGIRIIYADLRTRACTLVAGGWQIVDSTALSIEQTAACVRMLDPSRPGPELPDRSTP